MSEPQMIACCSNGHVQPMLNSKFCIYCGEPTQLQPLAGTASSNAGSFAPNAMAHAANTSVPSAFVPPATATPVAAPIISGKSSNPGCCNTCGGDGSRLAANRVVCPECRWLRPLVPGYQVDASAFAWAGDAKAMATLRSVKVLTAAAAAVSEKVGRRWIEVTFNGIRLSEKQMPQIYSQAVRAARVLGMSHMPDLYLSGERPWDMLTFGTDRDSFIVIGSAIAANFMGPDMYFLLARQLGHCKAGHSLWKTVIRFLLGDQGPQKGVLAGGVLNTMLNPTALLSGAIEMPLLGWARQAEITADRAGMLAVGNEEVARRVLMSWSLKSSHLYQQLNMNAWVEQQSLEEDQTLRLSELLTTSTPYLGPRLKLLQQYARSPELKSYLRIIGDSIRKNQPTTKPAVTKPTNTLGSNGESSGSRRGPTSIREPNPGNPTTPAMSANGESSGSLRGPTSIREQNPGNPTDPAVSANGQSSGSLGNPNRTAERSTTLNGQPSSSLPSAKMEVKNPKLPVTALKIKCTACGSKLSIPANALNQVDRRPIRCPNTACGTITLLEKRVQSTSQPSPETKRQLETMTHGD